MTNVSFMAASVAFLSLVGVTACASPQRVAQADNPKDFQNFMAFGNEAMENHEWKAARIFFLRAHDMEPENATVVYRFAEADLLGYDYDGELGRSRRMIEQALATASPAEAQKLLDVQTRIALREGRLADAQNALDEMQALPQADNPNFPDLLQETDASLAQGLASFTDRRPAQ